MNSGTAVFYEGTDNRETPGLADIRFILSNYFNG